MWISKDGQMIRKNVYADAVHDCRQNPLTIKVNIS